MKNRAVEWLVRGVVCMLGIAVLAIVAFLFLYIFWKGKDVLSLSFLLDSPKGFDGGGIFPALVGTLELGALSALFGGFIGIGVAIYLEYYGQNRRLGRAVESTVRALSGIPSIIFGLVCYTGFIYYLHFPRSILCAAVTVAMMILPFVAIRARKVLKERGELYLRESVNVGISREFTLRHLILPSCIWQLLECVLLGMAFGMGAVAPIIYTGVVMQAGIPQNLTDPFMSLSYHLYILVQNGYSMEYAYGTAFVLLAMLILIHLLCKLLCGIGAPRDKRAKKTEGKVRQSDGKIRS